MLKNALSLNRLANVFYVILKDLEEYYFNSENMSSEQKKDKLQRILRVTDIAINVLDRKVRLKGIGKDFIDAAREIKREHTKENKDWRQYLNILEWFKTQTTIYVIQDVTNGTKTS